MLYKIHPRRPDTRLGRVALVLLEMGQLALVLAFIYVFMSGLDSVLY